MLIYDNHFQLKEQLCFRNRAMPFAIATHVHHPTIKTSTSQRSRQNEQQQQKKMNDVLKQHLYLHYCHSFCSAS